MSKIKNSVPQHILDDPQLLNKYILEEEIKEHLEAGIFEDKSLLREFLEDITPTVGPNYFIYVEDDTTYVNMPMTREEYINALCCLSQYELTLFLHPAASFTKWIENMYATAVRCLYVDIDDIGMVADETGYNDAVNYLIDNFCISKEQLPNYISLSGYGMHLIYLIDELTADDEEIRSLYSNSLIAKMINILSGMYASDKTYHYRYETVAKLLYITSSCFN